MTVNSSEIKTLLFWENYQHPVFTSQESETYEWILLKQI